MRAQMHYGTMHAFWLWVNQCEVHQGKAGDNEIVTKSYKCNCVNIRQSCTIVRMVEDWLKNGMGLV